jgi:hypothetical protein
VGEVEKEESIESVKEPSEHQNILDKFVLERSIIYEDE